MSKMKKVFAITVMVVFALTIMLSGCGKAAETAKPAEPAAKAEESKKEEPKKEEAKGDKPVTLTWMLVGPGQEPETDKICAEANKYLKDKLNVNIDLQVFGYGDAYNQKVNTMLAAGDPFDICFTASWAADLRTNANSGYFKQLDDYLKDSPVRQVVGDDFLNGVKINGKTFAVPCNKEKVHNWGFLLKKDLTDKYQVDVKSIKKMEDLEPYFEKIKKNEKGVIPLLSVQAEAPFKLLDWDNFSDDSIPGAVYPDNRDTKVINQFTAPESITHYKKMREYFQKGYLSPDAATMENFNDQLKTGKYFACVQSLKPGKDAEMKGSTNGIDWVQVDITKPVMSNRETGGSLLAIPTASKNPDKAWKFIEMLYTDKFLNNLFVYGIEGQHYQKVSDNVVKLLGGDKSGYKAGNGWRFGDQFKNYLMDNEDPQKWTKFEEFNKAGLPLKSLGFAFDKSKVDTQASACKNVVEAYYKQLFTGSVDIDSTVKKMDKDLKDAGVDKLIQEMQAQYDAWLAKNGKK